MTDKKASRSNRIPISFPDSEEESEISNRPHSDDFEEDAGCCSRGRGDRPFDPDEEEADQTPSSSQSNPIRPLPQRGSGELGGPVVAELVATRAELKRVEGGSK